MLIFVCETYLCSACLYPAQSFFLDEECTGTARSMTVVIADDRFSDSGRYKNLKLSFSKLEAHMPWRIAPSLKKKNEVTYFVFGYFLPTDYSGTKKEAK